MTESKAIVLVVDQSLEPETAGSLRQSFAALFDQAEAWRAKALSITVTDPSQGREMKLARETRLALREIRIKAEKVRKSLKEESLRKGRAIDGLYNILEHAIVPLEEHLQAQEDFVKRIEAERLAAVVAQRREQLAPFVKDVNVYVLDSMDDEAFGHLLSTHREAHESRLAAEKRAADERAAREAAELEERERMKAENERLRREAAERERERVRLEEAARVERERAAAAERAASAARAREEAEARRRQAEEDARRAREEAEARRRQAEEDARRAREEAEAARRAAAPDHEKVADWLQRIALQEPPEALTPLGTEMVNEIARRLSRFVGESKSWLDSKMSN